MDSGAWRATVHRVAKSWTQQKQLSIHTHTHTHTHEERSGLCPQLLERDLQAPGMECVRAVPFFAGARGLPWWSSGYCASKGRGSDSIPGWKNKISLFRMVVVVQSPSRVQLFATSWTAAHQASLSLTISQNLPKFMSIQSVMPSNHFILYRLLLLLPLIFPSIRVFSNESFVHIELQPENKTKDSGLIIQFFFIGVFPTGQLLATGQIYDGGPGPYDIRSTYRKV